jgi:hypothetical protein
MTVAGMPGLGRAPVALVRRVTTPGWDAFGLVSDAVGGVRLRRDVLVLRGPDLLAVYDRTDLPRAAAATQRWHLPPDLAVTVQGRGRAVASDGDTKLVLVSIRLDGAARDLATVRGSRHPPQGFVFPSLRVAVPADMVSLTTTARRVRMLTMAIPAAQAAQVDARVVAAANGARHVAVRVGTQVVHIVVARDGSLSRA